MWWHNWGREDHDQLACALVAGHLIVRINTVHLNLFSLTCHRNVAHM